MSYRPTLPQNPLNGLAGGAMSLLGSIGNFITSKTPKKPKPAAPKAKFALEGVADDSPEAFDSEWTPENRGLEIPERSSERKAIYDLIYKRFEKASRYRQPLLRQWLEALAYTRGYYWMGWDNQGRFISRKDADDPYRTYVNEDIITPEIAKLIARVNSGKPDAGVKPLTQSDLDREDAAVTRSVLAYCDQKFNRPVQNMRAYRVSATFGCAWRKVCWDHNAEAEVVIALDPQTGEVAETAFAPVGDIFERIYSPFEILYDPKSEHPEESMWLIEARVVSLSEIHERYKDSPYAKYVKGGTVPDWHETFLMNYRTATTGQFPREFDLWDGANERNEMVLLLECWEKPSDRYLKGRLITVAGDQVLRYEDWPYDKKDSFPYSPLPYALNVGCPYPDGLVGQCLPLQQQYSQIKSRIIDRLNVDFPTIVVDEGARIGVDAFTSPRNYRFVYKKPGKSLEYMVPPAVPSYWYEELGRIKDTVKALCGTSISDGNAPPGVTAAAAIELFMAQDNSQIAEWLTHVEMYHQHGAQWEDALYFQYGVEPRMMAISDQTAKEARMSVVTYQARRNGGRSRIVITSGSAIPKSAAAIKEEAMLRYNAGLYGLPGSPEAVKMYWDVVESAKSEAATEAVTNSMRRAEEAAQRQAELEAALKQGEPVDPEEALAKDLALKEADANHKAQLELEKIDRQAEAQMAVDEHRGLVDVQKETEKARMGLQQSAMQHQMGMQQAQHQARLGVASKWAEPPKPTAKPAPKPKAKAR